LIRTSYYILIGKRPNFELNNLGVVHSCSAEELGLNVQPNFLLLKTLSTFKLDDQIKLGSNSSYTSLVNTSTDFLFYFYYVKRLKFSF